MGYPLINKEIVGPAAVNKALPLRADLAGELFNLRWTSPVLAAA